jgi:hypothetical protein
MVLLILGKKACLLVGGRYISFSVYGRMQLMSIKKGAELAEEWDNGRDNAEGSTDRESVCQE